MPLPNALMVGTGEYTTGFVGGAASSSDKGAGVVALTLMDLRRRGLLGTLLMAGTNGTRFPGIRAHLAEVIGRRYRDLDTLFTSFPDDATLHDPHAYLAALDSLSPGDLVTVFTPDDTHHAIALAAIEGGCHVLVAKPLVHTVVQHEELIAAAESRGVLCAVEMHKRWDPIYADARDRIRSLGHPSHFSAYMSQPKSQLETFRAWAGPSSDISYYLNAHHIDFLQWAIGDRARPVSVTALAATGHARAQGIPTEDSITLATRWEIAGTAHQATALFTASWMAPKSDVHSQQRFFYQGTTGELHIDQAHRGYGLATDADGFSSPNPLFMKYTPDAEGRFAGQHCYGYRSISDFVHAALSVNSGATTAADWHTRLASAASTLPVTAILEAGRQSLDQAGQAIPIAPEI